MELKPGYKQTEIGVIPEDWDFVQLKNCIDLKNGYAFQSVYFSDRGEVLLTPGNFSRTGGLQFDSTNTKQYNGKFPKDSVLSYGDLLLVMTDLTPDCKLLGKPAIVKTKEPLLHNQRIAKVVNNQRKAVNGFLFYVFLSEHYLRYLKDRATGSTVRHTSLRIISSFRTALPPKKEQIAVSKTLSDIDSLITSIEKLIEKKKLIMQGVMQELLTGKRRLPGFRREWETKRLGDVSVVIMGQSPDSKYYNADSKGIPLIQGNADIQNGKSVSRIWTKSITKECQKGAILITVRAPVGSVGISSSRACLGRGVCAVQPYSVNERYLYWQLKFSEDKWNESQQGSTFTSVNSNQIKDFCILCPTSFDEQAAIADVIEDIEIEIDLHIKQLNKQILLKQATMQELLTGRIRLI